MLGWGEKKRSGGGGEEEIERGDGGKKESSLLVCKCDRGNGGLFASLVQFLGHGFASIFASNGYNTRVAMGFHKFG